MLGRYYGNQAPTFLFPLAAIYPLSPRAAKDAHIVMAVPSRPLAGRVDRMSEANAGGVGGLFLLRASKSPPTRLASLATLPANGREGK